MLPDYEKSCGAVIFTLQGKTLRYLVVQYAHNLRYWGLVKGKMEGTETEMQTAQREIEEEVKLTDLQFLQGFHHQITYEPRPKATKDVVYFVARAFSQHVTLSDEHASYRWLSPAQAAKRITYQSDKEMLQKAHQFITKEYLPMHELVR